MAKQINAYTKERTAATLKADDLFDVDSTEDLGGTHESAKLKYSELLAAVNATVTNVYNASGTLSSARTMTMNNFNFTFLNGKVILKAPVTSEDRNFSVRDNVDVDWARFGFKEDGDTGELYLRDTVGDFLNAYNGNLELGYSAGSGLATLVVQGKDGFDVLTVAANGNANDLYVDSTGRVVIGSDVSTDDAEFSVHRTTWIEDTLYIGLAATGGATGVNIAGTSVFNVEGFGKLEAGDSDSHIRLEAVAQIELLVNATNWRFKEDTIDFSNIATDVGDVNSGEIYSDAGVVTIKP